jgi:glycosyltransferase involved in cell wall biosynthesis
MRFCMITTFYPPYSFGGDGVFVQRLSEELARRGHTVEVIHCIDSYRLLAGARPVPEDVHHSNVTVHVLHSRYGPLAPLLTHQTGRPLLHSARIREILARGFDVINYHNVSLIGGPGILALGSALKLYTLHEYWLVCPTHVLYKNRRAACAEPSCLRCTLIYGRPPQLWRHTHKLSRAIERIDCFIAGTRFAQEQHEKMGLGLRAVVLPHFAPWSDETPAPPSEAARVLPSDEAQVPPSDEHGTSAANELRLAEAGTEGQHERAHAGYFLFVGRLERLKGLQTILPILRRRPDLQLVVAGTGSGERSLRRQARDCGNVHFLGAVGGEALRRLYREAIALLVPSLSYEICPLVILEAFSQGTPVIARRIGGLPELVVPGVRGEAFTTPQEAETAMDRLLNDVAYRSLLGRECLQSCRRDFSLHTYVERYLELISNLSRRKPSEFQPVEAVGAPGDRRAVAGPEDPVCRRKEPG